MLDDVIDCNWKFFLIMQEHMFCILSQFWFSGPSWVKTFCHILFRWQFSRVICNNKPRPKYVTYELCHTAISSYCKEFLAKHHSANIWEGYPDKFFLHKRDDNSQYYWYMPLYGARINSCMVSFLCSWLINFKLCINQFWWFTYE